MRGQMLFLTCLLMAACQSGMPATAPPMPIAVNTPASSPTNAVLPTPAPTAKPSPTAIPILPTEYRPHPALRQVVSQTKEIPSQLRWDDNEHISFSVMSSDPCREISREIVLINDLSSQVKTQPCTSDNCPMGCLPALPIPSSLQNRKEFTGEITELITSPNKSSALVVEAVLTPTIKAHLGEEYSPQVTWQTWLLDARNNLRPLFSSSDGYLLLTWSPDSKFLIARHVCYGASYGKGLFIIDVATRSIYTIDPAYVFCEGDREFQIAPDSKHIIYHSGIVINMTGSLKASICGKDEFARSYSWSADGRYAYAACYKKDETDSLWRFDTKSQKTEIIAGPPDLAFNALEMALSPDQKYFAFAWGDSFMHPDYRGIWVIDLSKLDVLP